MTYTTSNNASDPPLVHLEVSVDNLQRTRRRLTKGIDATNLESDHSYRSKFEKPLDFLYCLGRR